MNICALATGRGGAIAIVRISGPDAIAIADKHFQPATKGGELLNARGQSLHYGHFVAPSTFSPEGRVYLDAGGRLAEDLPDSAFIIHNSALKNNSTLKEQEVVDEVLVSVFRAPHSYTGENLVEISCHASPYITGKILQALCLSGCRMAKGGEFTQRAFLAGKLDLSQAEAVADLIGASNAATHRMAMRQLRGGFSSELSQLREGLLYLTTLMELELDFSDHEELEFADRSQLLSLAQHISTRIDGLCQSFRLGNAIKHGVPVAIIGAPNVGKSTLLNALLGDDRAIVSEIQGTTRDLIEDTVTLGDVTFRFIDTAGIRHTSDAIEQLGIERSRKAAEKAHIVILLTEPGVEFPAMDFRPDQTVIRIVNKTSDFQAINGIGLAELEQQLIQAVGLPEDDIIVSNARHYEALCAARQSLQQVIDGIKQGIPTDLLAEDLRSCLSSLAEITGGAITTDETLSNIFSHFCIGK